MQPVAVIVLLCELQNGALSSGLDNGVWSGFSISISPLAWPVQGRTHTPLCGGAAPRFPPQPMLREDLTGAMRIIGQGAGLHNTDSVMVGLVRQAQGSPGAWFSFS